MSLSIITINRNNAIGLQKTIESVFAQTSKDFEYIVVDGASTDGSKELICQYANPDNLESMPLNSQFSWISEPDTGIYNAMNKGIKLAKGEYLLFLNSGDWFYDTKVVDDFNMMNFNDDLVAGNIIYSDDRETKLRSFSGERNKMFLQFFQDTNMAHQATFIKKELFLKYGFYNENYKYSSDWEFFMLVLFLKNVSYSYYNRIISYYDSTGLSAQEDSQSLLRKEREQVINEYFPLIGEAFKSLIRENAMFKSHEHHYNEYMMMRKGKFSILVRAIAKMYRKKGKK